jgi:hypothetical protein
MPYFFEISLFTLCLYIKRDYGAHTWFWLIDAENPIWKLGDITVVDTLTFQESDHMIKAAGTRIRGILPVLQGQ